MTTTVTVKTHDWPVAVSSESNHSHSSPERQSWGYSSTTEFVPANSERTFNVTDTQSFSVRELPKDATGLEQPQEATSLAGSTHSTAANEAIADAGLAG